MQMARLHGADTTFMDDKHRHWLVNQSHFITLPPVRASPREIYPIQLPASQVWVPFNSFIASSPWPMQTRAD